MESFIENLHTRAIDAALTQDWDEAIQANTQILELLPKNVDAQLALAFAYLQKEDYKTSEKWYRAALKIEPLNQIARNNLDKIEILTKKNITKSSKKKVIISPESLVNVAGKTKITHLVNLGQADALAKLETGEQLTLQVKKRRVEVRNLDNEYIGALPDDISKRLMYFMKCGSDYSVFNKSSLKNEVEVFLREDKKNAKMSPYISFPINIQDDLKVMMQEYQEDESDDDTDDEHDHEEEHADDKPTQGTKEQGAHPDGEDDSDETDVEEEIEDIDALAESVDDDDSFMPDYNRYSDEEYDE